MYLFKIMKTSQSLLFTNNNTNCLKVTDKGEKMYEREKIIYLWFEMWLKQEDLGIDKIFTQDIVYTESWGPEYNGINSLKQWFSEWNTRGKVLKWDIKQFFHKGNSTVVEWYFKNTMNNGDTEDFDGMSLVEWTPDNKIKLLKEFGCNIDRYNPYKNSNTPEFKKQKINWF